MIRLCTRAPLNFTRNSCAPSTVRCASIASTVSAWLGARPRRGAGAGFARLVARLSAASSESLSPLDSDSSLSSLSSLLSSSLLDPRARRGLRGVTGAQSARGKGDVRMCQQSQLRKI